MTGPGKLPISPDAEELALRRASLAAWKTGTRPATFRAMVTRRERQTEGYRRVAYRIERRTVALQVAPAPGVRASELVAPPNPQAVDPWAVDPAALPTASAVLCACPGCGGEKRVQCPACAATGQIRCGDCGGGGKVSGQRGPKNCPSCRGKGHIKCGACTKGMAKCGPCDGVGRVRAWLEVHAQPRVQVRVYPDSGIAALHPLRGSLEDFDRSPADYRVPLVQDSQWMPALPEPLGPDLAPAIDPRSERVVTQRIQRFESTVYNFEYTTRTSQGRVVVAGRPPEVLAGSVWGPLWRRLALALGAGALMFFVGGVVGGRYVQRAPWFADHGNAGAIVALVLVASVATAIAAAGRWSPAAVRTRPERSPAIWTVACAWLAIAVLWQVGGPSFGSAELAIARGDLGAAQAELMALAVTEGPSERLTVARARVAQAEAEARRQRDVAADELHLVEVREAPSAEAALGRLRLPWKTPELQPQARELALRRARDELGPRLQAEDATALEALAGAVEELDAALAEQARARSHLARAASLGRRGDFADAFAALEGWTGDAEAERLRAELRPALEARLRQAIEGAALDVDDHAARREATELALARARLLESRTRSAASHTVKSLQARLEQAEKALQREQKQAAEAERKRLVAEARARKKIEQAERRRVAAEESAAARRASLADRVECCDGTTSPSCRYSQGSLRGCCSHHGGVC